MKKPVEFLYECSNFNDNINNMRLNNKMCDVTIKVDGKEFPAHKNILVANLKYFETMLSNDSFQEGKDSVVNMECVKATDLETFIIYAYTGKILLTEANALGYLEVANYLNEDGIKQACIEFLKKNLKAEDAFRAYNFASAIDCVSLKDAAKKIILSNFSDSSQTLEYLNLEFDNLKDLLSGVKVGGVETQESLFKVIINWIMNDFEGRKNRIEDLMTLIDMKQLTADYLLRCFGSVAGREDTNFKIIEDIMDYYESRSKNQKTEPEIEDSEKSLIVMGKNGDTQSYIQFYNFTENKWSPREEIPHSNNVVDYSNCVVLNDKVYYTAKSSGGNHLHAFDPATRHITSLHSSGIILIQAAICTCSKFVYLCGGVGKNKSRSDQVLKYDPDTDAFENLPPMAIKRAGAAAIIYQGCLYIVGGTDALETHAILKSVEKYDPDTKKWSKFPWLREPRLLHSLVVLDEKLYVCGGTTVCSSGHSKISSVEFYDRTTKSWRSAADMNKSRAEFLVIAREGKLWAIGGDEERTVEVYDPSKDQWQMDDEMSAGLKILYLRGGFITTSCLASAAMKILFR